MNWNWVLLVAFVVALVILPRFIVELAWGRRVQMKAKATGVVRMSIGDRLKAQTRPWIAFGLVGLVGAIVAIVALLASR